MSSDSSSRIPPPSPVWDPERQVHGRPPALAANDDDSEDETFQIPDAGSVPTKRVRPGYERRSDGTSGGSALGRGGRGGTGLGQGAAGRNFLNYTQRTELLDFQQYVRLRLSQLDAALPPAHDVREKAELAFLEERVIGTERSKRMRRLRDPLRDTPVKDITHTNLALLSRFVSDSGAILPRKLTGVCKKKQKAIAQSIKRAHRLNLMPVTWKLPKYRHSSYATDDVPRPPPPLRPDEEDFADPRDIRFPGQLESKSRFEIESARLGMITPQVTS